MASASLYAQQNDKQNEQAVQQQTAAEEFALEGGVIPIQNDPIFIDITRFSGREFYGEKSYIRIFNGKITAEIPSVVGMVRTGVNTSAYALTFKECNANVTEPRVDKKKKSYTFYVTATGGTFFGSWSNLRWRFTIRIKSDGSAYVDVESDEIGRLSSNRNWRFDGNINLERTKALTMARNSADNEF